MKKTISYIFPIYNESGNIELLYDTMRRLLVPLEQYEFELIFVNDGSLDNSLELLRALQVADPRVTVINFARNFGHQIAVTAGIDHSTGDAVIIMDSDMQDPPRVSVELIAKWEEGWDVVYAQRRTRKDGVFKRLTAFLFYWAMSRLADIDIPRNTGDFRLIDRRVVDALSKFKEHNRFLRGLVSYVGFRQAAVLFDRDERHAGVTGYPFKKMMKFAIDGVLSFSWAPLKLITRVGYIISAASFLMALYALLVKLIEPQTAVSGWTFIVIAISLIGGIQLIMLGVLGGYIGRIYTETQNRPLYIIESVASRRTKKNTAHAADS
ncbi:MAG TPA: glycosyltransferase family 2 protein [Candidatus Saccharimonadales bacterium]|nr:glycosyltransferase family 2 protein [Candidatus Saccharimonadales bacterium]